MPSTTSTSVWKKVQRKTKIPILYTGLWTILAKKNFTQPQKRYLRIQRRYQYLCPAMCHFKIPRYNSYYICKKNMQFFSKYYFVLFMQTHPQTPPTKEGWKMAVAWSISVLFSPVAMVLQRHQVINHNWARKEIHTKAYFPTMQKKWGKNAGRRMKKAEES